jgi:predicted AAA+ superfamily ATPase
MIRERYLFHQIQGDLKKKMVFLGGPRQVGKTTLVKSILGKEDKNAYLNWDIDEHRERILNKELPLNKTWVFDELHKYRAWRRFLKGLYDGKSAEQKILVTGSARLDFYRQGGDSLQGRYFYWRLHPLSVAELGITTQKDVMELLELGGFPEPYFSSSEIDSKRWSREYRNRLIYDDIIGLEHIKDIGTLELLIMRLPDLVGSPLSINSLREDLQINHLTVERWVAMLERMYAIFRVPPFGSPRIRAVKKEQKHYHFDWTLVKDRSLRFENMVACHLLKWVHFQQDGAGRDVELRYFRDVDKREVDFVVVEDGKPFQCIECKWGRQDVHPALRYFKEKFPACEAIQVAAEGKDDFVTPDKIRIMPAVDFLKSLV